METIDRSQPAEHTEKLRRRVIALFFSGLALIAAVAVGIGRVSAGFGSMHLGWLNQVIGPVLLVVGLALVVWSVSIQYTVGHGTPAPVAATRRLVTQGPYAYSRNPMTLGAMALYVGIGVWMGSGVVIAFSGIVFIMLFTFIYIHETRELTKRFGKEYLVYRERTPFLFPRCRRPLRYKR